MEQAGEVDYLITWRDNEFVGRVSLTPCRRAGANRRCFAFPKSPSCLRLCLHPRITLHFTPTSASWMNMVEVFFGIITRQAIRRGTFTSVPDLIGAIRAFIDAYNQRCRPFNWTKTADQILTTADRQKNSDTRH